MITIRGTDLGDGTFRVTVSEWLSEGPYPVVVDQRDYARLTTSRDRLAFGWEVAKAACWMLEELSDERASDERIGANPRASSGTA